MRQVDAKTEDARLPERARIVAALESCPAVDAADIDVLVTDQCVTLSGTVGSCAERREADRVAWSSPGVRIVHDLIAIQPASRR